MPVQTWIFDRHLMHCVWQKWGSCSSWQLQHRGDKGCHSVSSARCMAQRWSKSQTIDVWISWTSHIRFTLESSSCPIFVLDPGSWDGGSCEKLVSRSSYRQWSKGSKQDCGPSICKSKIGDCNCKNVAMCFQLSRRFWLCCIFTSQTGFLDSTILHFAHMCEEILSCCQSLCAGHQPIHGTTERKGESGTKEIFEVPLFQYFLLQQGSVTTIWWMDLSVEHPIVSLQSYVVIKCLF